MVGRRYGIMVRVYRALGDEPVELHIVGEAMLDGWYKRFIPVDELIEV